MTAAAISDPDGTLADTPPVSNRLLVALLVTEEAAA